MDDFEKRVKEIAEELNATEFINKGLSPITLEDINKINKTTAVRASMDNGIDIIVKLQHKVDLVLGIPTLFFSDKYVIADIVLGEHPLEFSNKEEVLAYANSLLGHEVNA
jgi:hypothetical protein